MPAADHSMIESADAGDVPMQPLQFATSPRFDYVEGRKQSWTRQIVLVKGESSDRPAYFVISDTLKSEQPASWRLLLTADRVDARTQGEMRVHVSGKEDVDMDIFFLDPSITRSVFFEEKTRLCSSGLYPNWSWRAMETTQHALTFNMEAGPPGNKRVAAVLFPRLKSDAPPTVTPIAEGRGVKIQHDAGIDYVLLSESQFQFRDSELRFDGRAGMVQLRGKGEPVLQVAGRGRISAAGKQMEK